MHSRTPEAVAARLIPFPAALFVAALLTDVAYWQGADPLWSTMSSWLLLAGLIAAALAMAAEVILLAAGPEPRDQGRRRLVLHAGVVALSALNFVFHVRDGYSAVVPAGPLLSAAAVLVLLSTVWAAPRARPVPVVAKRAAADRRGA
jgi:uncharacterized membrane protein